MTPPRAGRRPLGLIAMNRIGGVLRAAGLPLVRLDEASLLARASKSTRLEDFGDPAFHEPLRRLIESLEHEAQLTLLGRVIARNDLVRLLENRLRITATLERHPEIQERPIRGPLFIIGLPRSGTTILHELLAQDPANRVPLSWEAMYPWPPPERETYQHDPRIAEVEKHFQGVDRIMPGFKQMHRMGAQLPQECVALMALEFSTILFHTTHRVPSYQAWIDKTDLRPVYASHKRQLQYLAWRCPAERWVLKSPQHLWSLDALLAIYPDARIVQTHRDPVRVLASLCNLITRLRSMASDHIDPVEIGADWSQRLAEGLMATMDVRASGLVKSDQIFDLQLADFVRDEISMIRRIYAQFELKLSDEAEARMRRYLAENPSDKHGAHRYTLAPSGLDPQAERKRFARYQEHYDIASETA